MRYNNIVDSMLEACYNDYTLNSANALDSLEDIVSKD